MNQEALVAWQHTLGAQLAAKFPRLPHGGSILDAGGSYGRLAGALQLAPSQLTILDPAQAELSAAPTGARQIQGWLEDPIPGTYDGVLCLETLDHVTAPIDALRHLRNACPMGWMLADYVCGSQVKIDHPLYWHERAWQQALAGSGWTVTTTGTTTMYGSQHRTFFCQ